MQRSQAITGVVAMLLLTGCAVSPAGTPAATPSRTPALGMVSGRFLIEGGPLRPGGRQPGARPIPGLVAFTAGRSRPINVLVGRSGRFSVQLPTGMYTVLGRSPDVIEVAGNGSKHETPCSQPLQVDVTARHTTRITVICIVP